eukprot:809495-Prorocentrum_minimum.AAC.1
MRSKANAQKEMQDALQQQILEKKRLQVKGGGKGGSESARRGSVKGTEGVRRGSSNEISVESEVAARVSATLFRSQERRDPLERREACQTERDTLARRVARNCGGGAIAAAEVP